MTTWLETYRGIVNAWECDVVEHFTIAYYFERFADATSNFIDLIDEAGSVGASARAGALRAHATFQHELRAGAGFHIVTAITGVGERQLELGHRVVDSASEKTVAWLAATHGLPDALPAATTQKLASLCVAWPGPKVPDRAAPAPSGRLAARDRVKAWEIDEEGTLSLPASIHRFSAAGTQALAMIGMTAAYMQEQKRGFSTFELELNRTGSAEVGDIIDVTTAVAHLGKSSLRFAHHMTGPKGRAIAYLGQSGVHLDMDARRSTPIPDALRTPIRELMIQHC